MEIKTINKEHKEILDFFSTEVKGFIYRITEDEHSNSFRHFKPVISNATQLHNNIGKELKNMKIDESEWVYMFPNYLLFAGIGFAAAIKTKKNESLINEETESLFEMIADTMSDLEHMITKKQLKDLNKTKQTKTND